MVHGGRYILLFSFLAGESACQYVPRADERPERDIFVRPYVDRPCVVVARTSSARVRIC